MLAGPKLETESNQKAPRIAIKTCRLWRPCPIPVFLQKGKISIKNSLKIEKKKKKVELDKGIKTTISSIDQVPYEGYHLHCMGHHIEHDQITVG